MFCVAKDDFFEFLGEELFRVCSGLMNPSLSPSNSSSCRPKDDINLDRQEERWYVIHEMSSPRTFLSSRFIARHRFRLCRRRG